MDRDSAMEQEFSKSPGGNYFTYVDTAKLERLGITQYKPSVGDNMIRIVFPPERKGFYGFEIFKHSNVGVNRKTFLCYQKMFNEKCLICDLSDSLRRDDPQDKRAAELYASRRYLFFVVDVSSDAEMAKGVRWFDCPIKLFNEIRARSKNKRRGGSEDGKDFKKWVDISDPKEGRDISYEQTKEGKQYAYVGVELLTSDPCPNEWYEDLPEFKDILKISSEEEIQQALSGETSSEEDLVDDTNDDTTDTVVEDDSPRRRSPERTKEVVEDDSPPKEDKEEKQEETSPAPTRRSAGTSRGSSIKEKIQERLERAKQAKAEEEQAS